MTWHLLAITALLIALGALVTRRVVRRRRLVRPDRDRNTVLAGGRRGSGLFDARAWPRGGVDAAPQNYHRPAGIRLANPAILPPPREMPDE